jgi:hypothetical protein
MKSKYQYPASHEFYFKGNAGNKINLTDPRLAKALGGAIVNGKIEGSLTRNGRMYNFRIMKHGQENRELRGNSRPNANNIIFGNNNNNNNNPNPYSVPAYRRLPGVKMEVGYQNRTINTKNMKANFTKLFKSAVKKYKKTETRRHKREMKELGNLSKNPMNAMNRLFGSVNLRHRLLTPIRTTQMREVNFTKPIFKRRLPNNY